MSLGWRPASAYTFTVTRYPGQVRGFISNAKLLPKAYDAIEDSRGQLSANQ